MRVEREVHVNNVVVDGIKWKLPITYVQRIAWRRVSLYSFGIYIHVHVVKDLSLVVYE